MGRLGFVTDRSLKLTISDRGNLSLPPDIPLTLKELIGFITDSRQPELEGSLALAYNNMNADDSNRYELRHFTTITSSFYPQLYEHFEKVFGDWAQELEEEK